MTSPGQLTALGNIRAGDGPAWPAEILPGTPWSWLRLPLPERRVFPGRAIALGVVRGFIRLELAGHPALDVTELVASELATNAIAHTASGQPGGMFEVQVGRLNRSDAAVMVADQGAPTTPAPQRAALEAESGRGLDLVTAMSAAFTVLGSSGGHLTLAVVTG